MNKKYNIPAIALLALLFLVLSNTLFVFPNWIKVSVPFILLFIGFYLLFKPK